MAAMQAPGYLSDPAERAAWERLYRLHGGCTHLQHLMTAGHDCAIRALLLDADVVLAWLTLRRHARQREGFA